MEMSVLARMCEQEAIWTGFSVLVGLGVYIYSFQSGRCRRKILHLINLSAFSSRNTGSTLEALCTCHLLTPADGSYYMLYWKEKKLVKRWVIAL